MTALGALCLKLSNTNNQSISINSLHTRIEELFVWQFYMARKRFEYWSSQIWSPVIGLGSRDSRPRGFSQVSYRKLKDAMKEVITKNKWPVEINSPLHTIPIRYTDMGLHLNNPYSCPDFEYGRLKAFIDFLAYRSAGNPKRLNELLGTFIMSVDRVVPNKDARDEGFNCQDVLYLPDHKVMRIQLIARVYRQLRNKFEGKIRGRDDKVIVSLIYLSDFLFKFHERAFSWESLELIDELAHMHRGHDLRLLLHELVEHYSDRYLHRITNGMYSYRFRSYFANEVEFLCRHSEEEMAAFNFTLDEAQTLRDHLMKLLGQEDDRDKTDILSMLGELHELYQEYEMARQYYRRCINARYPSLKENVGEIVGDGDDEMPILQAIYTNTASGRKALLAVMQWGPITLRLFLKIAMTYERAGNYDEALIRYERCIKFAEAMIQAFATHDNSILPFYASNSSLGRTHVLEYMGILFEPLFSYAWLLNKGPHTSGSSIRIIADGIKNFERVLKHTPERNSLWLARVQWRKKAGALCFYNGLANVSGSISVNLALAHYKESAMALSSYLQEVNVPQSSSSLESLPRNKKPVDFNLRIAECLGDLSEGIFATKLNPELLVTTQCTDIPNATVDIDTVFSELFDQIDSWFYEKRRSGKDNLCLLDFLSKEYSSPKFESLKFESLNALKQLDMALNLSFASSHYLSRAGYYESAAREAMHTVEIINQYLNWFCFLYANDKAEQVEKLYLPGIRIMMRKIKWYTQFLLKTLSNVRMEGGEVVDSALSKSYLIGAVIPASALTSLSSIGFSLSMFKDHDGQGKEDMKPYLMEVSQVINEWTGLPKMNSLYYHGYQHWHSFFEQVIIRSLRRHRYPVLNQLNALKSLVDASLVKGILTKDKSYTKNTAAWLQELYQINKKYDHPLHFTPLQSGLSMYLYVYAKSKLELPPIEDFDLLAETHRQLVQSVDMCHMGRGYYAAIDKMYYLFDDFNDNQIHRNHAMQIAGSKLVSNALESIILKK